jgi:DNA (cytosine-5)-methyltransferase 1
MAGSADLRFKKWPIALDLFSGCGGLTQGLRRARFRVAGAVEIDELAVETYRLNHASVPHVWQRDIRDLPGSEILGELEIDRGELDLLAGCPPCQGFSTMTTLNGNRQVDDPRNDLVDEYVRLVDELWPRALLMENVPGLAKDIRMERLFESIEELGYETDGVVRVLDTAAFGIPQRRKRLVLLTSREGSVTFAEPSSRRRSVRDAISDLPRAGTSGDPLHDVAENRSPSVRELIGKIPVDGGSRLDLGESKQLKCHKKTDGFKDVYGRMAWDKPSPTITGGCQNPSKGRFLHPEENRTVTLREAAILQGFPRDFQFSLRRGKFAAAEMVGNAVPPGFVEAQARQLRRHLIGGASA